jgi:hypothetical protein
MGGRDAALKSSRERRSVIVAGEKPAIHGHIGCLHGFTLRLVDFRLSSIASFERNS